MAKYQVLKKFRDKETKEVYSANKVIEMTVKRAKEVTDNLGDGYLKRIDNKDKE